MISAFWLIPIAYLILFGGLAAWMDISTLKIDRDLWRDKYLIEKTYARNIEHIHKGEPTEAYPCEIFDKKKGK